MNESIFIEKPNLPKFAVSELIISGRYKFVIDELKRLGISVIETDELSEVYGVEKYHTDISTIHLCNDNLLVAKNNTVLADKLSFLGYNVSLSKKIISGKYPSCTALNAVLLGNKMICRESSIDDKLIEYCKKNSIKIISVKQGYARCSTAVVAENAVITSDNGIYKACIENSIDALKIESGYIEIEDYDYGFIGGSCGKLSDDILAFCGDVKVHKNYDDIKAFALNYGINLISLSNKRLFDIGGFIPTKQEENY